MHTQGRLRTTDSRKWGGGTHTCTTHDVHNVKQKKRKQKNNKQNENAHIGALAYKDSQTARAHTHYKNRAKIKYTHIDAYTAHDGTHTHTQTLRK